jgi:hypothetical protein
MHPKPCSARCRLVLRGVSFDSFFRHLIVDLHDSFAPSCVGVICSQMQLHCQQCIGTCLVSLVLLWGVQLAAGCQPRQ